MKIALVTSIAPFIKGGYRNIVDWLDDALVRAGHETEQIAIPVDEDPRPLRSQLAMFRSIDLTDRADRVVCFRPPAFLVRHPHKIVWFIHHLRIYYDLWESDFNFLGRGLLNQARRDLIQEADTRALSEAAHIFTNSQVVSERLKRFNGLDSEVLYPPLPPVDSADRGLGDEIVAVSRLEGHKRQLLLVEALGRTRTPVKLRFVGTGATDDYPRLLVNTARELGVADRVFVDNRWASEDEKIELVGSALAGAYIPVDEDSYGYPSLEYARASKAVITASDSGGTSEFVRDGHNGYIVPPDAGALARVMDELYTDRAKAAAMGRAAHDTIDELGISWEHVVDRITSA